MSDVEDPVVGHRGDAYEVVVEAGKIREFARATRARGHSWYAPDAIAPPTYLTADRFWAESANRVLERANVNWARILHGEEEYVFHGAPPAAGEHLTAQQTVADVFDKEGRRGGSMRFIVVVTEYRADDGRLVAEARHTVIETSKAASA